MTPCLPPFLLPMIQAYLVYLECSSCASNAGVRLGFPLSSLAAPFTGSDLAVSIPLTETAGWLQDTKNTLQVGRPPPSVRHVDHAGRPLVGSGDGRGDRGRRSKCERTVGTRLSLVVFMWCVRDGAIRRGVRRAAALSSRCCRRSRA